MASRQSITQPDFSKFLSALTAVDQVPKDERRMAKAEWRRAVSDERYEANMKAAVAYHRAKAACLASTCARVTGSADAASAESNAYAAISDLFSAMTKLMSVPLLGKADIESRRRAMKKYRDAIVFVADVNLWKWWCGRWEGQLAVLEGRSA
jgi:hypothetical protein